MNQEQEQILETSIGDFPLDECRLSLGAREWKILHVGAVLSRAAENRYLNKEKDHLPYGVTLWASAIALANEAATRAADFRGRAVLELGAGTGLPGIVAASHGARVVQTDRNNLVLALCRRNAALNGVRGVEQSLMDWTDWRETGRYDWIFGSDILYAEEMHPHVRRIFEANLAPGGRILLADPFRENTFKFLEAREAEGWRLTIGKWSIGEEGDLRQIGVFELAPPAA